MTDRYLEEEYFDSLCIVLDNINYPPAEIENKAHSVLDNYTKDGVLNTDGVEAYMDELMGVSVSDDWSWE